MTKGTSSDYVNSAAHTCPNGGPCTVPELPLLQGAAGDRANEHPELARQGGMWLKLDVTSPDTEQIVREAVEKEGHVDVVVKNAGYTIVGGVEDLR